MSTTALKAGVHSYYTQLAGFIRDMDREFDANKIHQLRIILKKLRAILRWQKANKKIFQNLKMIYSLAGEIRDIQVVNKLIARQKNISASFKSWLASDLKDRKQEWGHMDHEKRLSRLKKDLQTVDLNHDKNETFFTQKVKEMKRKLKGDSISDTAIHDVRKLAKDILYTQKYLKKKRRADLSNELHLKKLEPITSKIGDYNDKNTLIRFLESYMKSKNILDLNKGVGLIMVNWRNRKTRQKQQLLNFIENTMFHH